MTIDEVLDGAVEAYLPHTNTPRNTLRKYAVEALADPANYRTVRGVFSASLVRRLREAGFADEDAQLWARLQVNDAGAFEEPHTTRLGPRARSAASTS